MPRETAIQSWPNLYTLDITSDECVSELRTLLNRPSEIIAARSFQGSEAGTFVDFLDQVLERSPLDEKLMQRCLRLLSKICKAQKIIPATYILQQELVNFGSVRYCGGFAEVSDGEYMARAVAIKRLKTNKGDFDKLFKRLCQETICWKHLSHPNILPLLGVFVLESSHCLCILSEWMHNGNIMQYAKSNPEVNRLQLLSEVASGVAYLHKLMVIHGDLKGANILVDNTGAARIGDFGLMTMGDLGTILFSESIHILGGTLPWMSPELLGSVCPDATIRPTRESDCYALGMVVYEVLTGLQPFHDLSALQIVVSVAVGRYPGKPLDARELGFSDELWELVELCWSTSSLDRPTARNLFDHLSDASRDWVPPPLYPITEFSTELDISSFWRLSLGDSVGEM